MANNASKATVQLQKDVGEMKSTIGEMTNTVNSVVDTINTLANTVSTMAKNNPVAPTRHFEASELDLGQPTGAARFVEKDGAQVLVHAEEEDEVEIISTEKAADLMFNEELLTVHILNTSEKDAQKVFEINVCGESEIFRRGETKTVKRKFVEGLARAKPINYENREYRGDDNLTHMEQVAEKGLRYPFALVKPSQIDESWLAHIAMQP